MRLAKGMLFAAVTLLAFLWGSAAGCAASPPAAVPRGQFTVELAQQLNLAPAPGSAQVFSDLPPSDPSFAVIMAAYQKGWISGYPDGTFRPAASLTREQVAKCEIIALGLQGAAQALANSAPAYGDAGSIGKWAWGYVNEAAKIGVLRGFSTSTFGPQRVLTAAQVRHVQTQLAAYLRTAVLPQLSPVPTAQPGDTVGATALAVTPQAGDSVAVAVSSSRIPAPTWGTQLPSGASAYTPGADLSASPNDYVGVYERNAQGTVVAFSELQIASADIAQAPAALAVTGPTSGVASGAATVGPFSVRLTDRSGNPAPAPPGGLTVTLTSTSAGTHVFSESASGPPTAVVIVPAGDTSASFYYGDTSAGSDTVTAQAPGLGSATADISVRAGAPARLVLTGPQSGFAGTQPTIGPFTLSLTDAFGNPAAAPAGGLLVGLASTSSSHAFAQTSAGVAVLSVTIPAGGTSATFYYGDGQSGLATVSATAPGVGGASMRIEITVATAAKVTLSGPQSAAAGASPTVGPFTVTLTDQSGNPVPAPGTGVEVALSSTSPTHEFATAAGGSPVAVAMIPPGATNATFYYGDGQAGVPTLSASAPGLASAAQPLEVAVPMPLTGMGLDSPVARATPAQVQSWVAQGYGTIFLNTFAPSFAQQYVSSLAALRVVLFQGYYTPAFTDETGLQRAQQAITAAQSVGYPKGAYIFVDVESTGAATPEQLILWINSWSAAVQAAGYGAGVYFGVPQPLSATQAGSLLADRFWKSFSSNSITPIPRGTCVVQTTFTGALDVDAFVTDNLGEYCIGAGL